MGEVGRRRLQSCPAGKFCVLVEITITVPIGGDALLAASLLQDAADSGKFTDALIAKGLDLDISGFKLTGDVELVFSSEPSAGPTSSPTDMPSDGPSTTPSGSPTASPTTPSPTASPSVSAYPTGDPTISGAPSISSYPTLA